MVTNTTNLVRRISTHLITVALAGIGTVAVGLAFPLDQAVAQAVQGAPTPGNATPKSFKDCDFCPEMVTIPGGSFLMGSPKTEKGHTVDELPQHHVKIGRPFAVGKYEVTIAEWQVCVKDTACIGDPGTSPGNDRRPKTGISWDDAQAYVAWLSRRTGKKYRLLSEAEWEYAARAGTTTPYHTGLTISPKQANIADKGKKTAGKKRRTGFGMKVTVKRTGPVGSFPPNGFGLHDVHGNVWEWVADCVNDGYVGAPTDGNAWASGKCHRRIIRGGSWVDYAVGARSAIRSGLGTGDRGRTLGLRVARTLN